MEEEKPARYDQQLMVPHLDYFLGVTLIVCSVVAVVGNVIAVLIMGRICKKGNAKFSTIIFLNIAVVNLVIGATSWIIPAPSLLSGDRYIPAWFLNPQSVQEICEYFLVNTEKMLSAVVLYSISYLAVTKLILYSNPLRTNPNRYYLLSQKTTVIVLVHFWVALFAFCLYPVLSRGSKFEAKVSKCVYDGMEGGDPNLVTWLSLYNFLCVILPLTLLLSVSGALVSRLVMLSKRQDEIFKNCSAIARSVVQVRSKKDMLRTILFAFNCLACYSGIMFVALREFVDLVKKTKNSSVTKNMPYAVIIGMGVLFTVNAAISPWIYLINNESVANLFRKPTSRSTKQRLAQDANSGGKLEDPTVAPSITDYRSTKL